MRIIALLIVLFCGWGCQSTEPDHLIVGEWVWVKSQGGWSGNDILTPKSATTVDKFTRKGRYESRTNGVLQSDADYVLETKKDAYGKSSSILTMKNRTLYNSDGKTVKAVVPEMFYYVSVNKQTLSYFDSFSEGYSHQYNRK